MPNWCENRVGVSGDAKEIQKFKKAVQGKRKTDCKAFCFNSILPMPPALLKTEAPNRNEKQAKRLTKLYGFPDWYAWAIANWGVKWDLANDWDPLVVEDSEFLEYNFDTAWGPPTGICAALRERFPELDISWLYAEPGCQCSGYL